jgi:hypothetical protein
MGWARTLLVADEREEIGWADTKRKSGRVTKNDHQIQVGISGEYRSAGIVPEDDLTAPTQTSG